MHCKTPRPIRALPMRRVAIRTAIRLGLSVAIAWVSWIPPRVAFAQGAIGAQSPDAAPMRRQLWRVPTQDRATIANALLFRPQGNGPFRLAIIAHASTQNAIRRAQMPPPEYRVLTQALVARGYAVLIPQRPGHGATGGPYLEDQGGCADADYVGAGRATAESITAALDFARTQAFIADEPALLIGHSAGGWGALALAGGDPKRIARIIAFAPGRGGHANDHTGEVCAPERLIAAARAFGNGARVPVTWIVADNDSYFPPALSQQLADAFRDGGGKVDFKVVPGVGDEGHWLAEREGGADALAQILSVSKR